MANLTRNGDPCKRCRLKAAWCGQCKGPADPPVVAPPVPAPPAAVVPIGNVPLPRTVDVAALEVTRGAINRFAALHGVTDAVAEAEIRALAEAALLDGSYTQNRSGIGGDLRLGGYTLHLNAAGDTVLGYVARSRRRLPSKATFPAAPTVVEPAVPLVSVRRVTPLSVRPSKRSAAAFRALTGLDAEAADFLLTRRLGSALREGDVRREGGGWLVTHAGMSFLLSADCRALLGVRQLSSPAASGPAASGPAVSGSAASGPGAAAA